MQSLRLLHELNAYSTSAAAVRSPNALRQSFMQQVARKVEMDIEIDERPLPDEEENKVAMEEEEEMIGENGEEGFPIHVKILPCSSVNLVDAGEPEIARRDSAKQNIVGSNFGASKNGEVKATKWKNGNSDDSSERRIAKEGEEKGKGRVVDGIGTGREGGGRSGTETEQGREMAEANGNGHDIGNGKIEEEGKWETGEECKGEMEEKEGNEDEEEGEPMEISPEQMERLRRRVLFPTETINEVCMFLTFAECNRAYTINRLFLGLLEPRRRICMEVFIKRLDDTRQRLDQTIQEVNERREHVTRLTEHIGNINARLEEMGNHLAELDNQIADNHSKLDKLQERIEKIRRFQKISDDDEERCD